MIDTHCHIDTEQFKDDWEKVVDDALSSGVEYIIVPGIEPKTFDRLIEVTDSNDKLKRGIGIHPHNANECDRVALGRVESLSSSSKVVAIGEIGLDYYYDFAPKEVQHKAFINQINIAKNLHLPIIVHNRESDEDLLKILEKEQDGNLKGVLHCFSGDTEMMKRSVDLGFKVSFTGNITFKKTNLTDVVKETTMENLLLETDSPWMAPIPHRGKRNEPKLVRLVAEKISEIKQIPINEVISMTSTNAKKLFGLALVMLFALALFNQNLHAQSRTTVYDDDYEEYEEEKDLYDLYPRTFGFGPVVGTNTIVETYSDGQDISYEGIVAIGGIVNYRLFPYLTLSGSYTYSENNKLVDQFKVDPNQHHAIEISSFWSPNPYGRVNFYGIFGFTYLMNKFGRRDYSVDPNGVKTYETDNKLGVNTGLGFNANVDFGNAGIMSFMLEWRLNFELNKATLDFDPRRNPETDPIRYNKKTDISTFYSIPRLSIVWYPKF